MTDDKRIEMMRVQYNAALARHDIGAMKQVFAPDYVCLPGAVGKPIDAEALGIALSNVFNDPHFVTYVRTPREVTVSARKERAAESGTWVGIWRRPDGEERQFGIYLAHWILCRGTWRLQNESFVTLGHFGAGLQPPREQSARRLADCPRIGD